MKKHIRNILNKFYKLIESEVSPTLKAELREKGILTMIAELVTIVVLLPSAFIILLILSEYMK
jgi:preprotein translocase subunit SecF